MMGSDSIFIPHLFLDSSFAAKVIYSYLCAISVDMELYIVIRRHALRKVNYFCKSLIIKRVTTEEDEGKFN